MTPLRSIRVKCLDCAAGEMGTVRSCEFETKCSLWLPRMGKDVKGKGGSMKPIRAFCLWCCRDQPAEVRLCSSDLCALHPYRLGRWPTTAGRLSKKTHPTPCVGQQTPASGPVGQDQQFALFSVAIEGQS